MKILSVAEGVTPAAVIKGWLYTTGYMLAQCKAF